VNFMKGMTDIIDFRIGDRYLSLTTISFDIFWMETVAPIIQGSAVVIGTGEQQMDPGAIARVILKESITMFQVTPSRLQLILSGSGAASSLKSLRYLQVGGESLPQGLLDQVRSLMGSNGRFYNLYAPSETTIYSTWKDLTGEGPVTIGKPIANTVIYILDKYLNPVPIGVCGEIYIGGHGVARGYLNNPELTEQKFLGVQGPFFKKVPGRRRLYKTGDLGRWLPDGDIELSGRIDFQVKIRGFRIELAEIEKRLSQYKNVKEAVVTARPDESGNKYLCAYYVPVEAEEGAIDAGELREFLGLELPEYMIPSYFVSLKEMPLTASRKIDRQALPDPVGGRAQVGSAYLAPQSDLEKQIAEQWIRVLNLDKVGIHDNFFNLGGNSMKIVQLNSRLKEVLGRDISVVSMFRHVTISSFARYLIEEGSEAAISGKEEQRRQKVEALDRSKNIFKNTLTRSQRGKI
jgi:acyl-coenzyme A synthetase/AMP-(fatty) acid ligase/aryl carrier-like protein